MRAFPSICTGYNRSNAMVQDATQSQLNILSSVLFSFHFTHRGGNLIRYNPDLTTCLLSVFEKNDAHRTFDIH